MNFSWSRSWPRGVVFCNDSRARSHNQLVYVLSLMAYLVMLSSRVLFTVCCCVNGVTALYACRIWFYEVSYDDLSSDVRSDGELTSHGAHWLTAQRRLTNLLQLSPMKVLNETRQGVHGMNQTRQLSSGVRLSPLDLQAYVPSRCHPSETINAGVNSTLLFCLQHLILLYIPRPIQSRNTR